MTARRGGRRLRVAIAAAVLAVAVPLTGCVSAFLPRQVPSTSTPVSEKVAPELEPFYTQVLKWSDCEDGTFQCTTATAPLDWQDPGAASISLALIRHPASGTPLGSLLVNPGGPGASGFSFIADSLDYAVDATVKSNYDIVGFDPRGVNRSSAVKCYDDPKEMDAYLYDITPGKIGSDAWLAAQRQASKAFGQACLKHTGDLLAHVDTVSAARDLDLLRAILGDTKLNYLGYSYGTLLGSTFAQLYPKKTGRMVFDGVVDPATTDFDVTSMQAQGFEKALRAYLADCLTGAECPFNGRGPSGVDAAMKQVRALLDSLDASPLRATDGRELGSSTMFTAIILPLYSRNNWGALSQLFTDVMRGDADFAFRLADSYNDRNANGTYTDNQTEAFIAINCLDYTTDGSTATLRAQAKKLAQLAPVFGPQMSYGDTCSEWPIASTRERGPIAAKGSAPILVVGTTNDPATPYQWAVNVSKQLENGHLVTYDGEGHTAYNKSNACVNNAVDDFLVDGKVPAADPKC